MEGLRHSVQPKFRENTIEEKRVMQRDRNKRKMVQRRKKRKALKMKRAKALDNAEAAIQETQRYKAIAKKYINLSTRHAKRNNSQVEIKSISCKHLREIKRTGKGVFGKCKLMMFQGQMVAAKEFGKSVTKKEVQREASILSKLSHPGIPFLLGIDLSEKPYTMVTLFYGINLDNTTLYDLLYSEKYTADSGIKLDHKQAISSITMLAEALAYVHGQGILHNDVKSDNIVFYLENAQMKPVLIDFGKACSMADGKYRKLSKEIWEKYRKNLSHIALEIVDGTAPQSSSSDIYSFGCVVKQIGEFTGSDQIIKIGNICAEPNLAKRCTLTFVLDECKLIYEKDNCDITAC